MGQPSKASKRAYALSERGKKNKRAYYEANIERIKAVERERFYKKTYGITIAEYDRMLLSQGGRCRICQRDTPGQSHKNFAVDHCHVTGVVRGLLCVRCNVFLGWYERNADAVSQYLEAAT